MDETAERKNEECPRLNRGMRKAGEEQAEEDGKGGRARTSAEHG